MRRGRLSARLLGLIAASLFVACADIEVEIAVDEDGSGILQTMVSFDRALLEGLSDVPVSTDSLLRDAGLDASTFPATVRYEPIETDERAGVRLDVPFEAGDDIPLQIDRAFASLGDDAGALLGAGGIFEAFALTREDEDGGWRFEASTPASDAPDGLSALLTQEASFTFRLRLPAEVTSTNADRIHEDGTLEWAIPLDGSSRSLTARATAGSSAGLPVRAALASGALIIAIALAAWQRLRPARSAEA